MRVRLAVLSSTKKEINSPSASLAVKQSSYVRKCFRCFFLGMPSCNDFTMLFQSRVALQGPSSTKLLSMFCFLLVLFTFQVAKLRIFKIKTSLSKYWPLIGQTTTDAALIGYMYFKVQNVHNKLNDHF